MPGTNREYEEISQAYAEVREELEELFKVGTDRPMVNDLLQEATRALGAGDHDKARLFIAKARSTAHTATRDFLNNWFNEVRNILLSARTVRADISISRPLLITAKKAMNARKYRKAAGLTFKSIDTMGGVSDEYKGTLKKLMRAKYNYTLVGSFGLDMRRARDQMDLAFGELKKGDYEEAILHSKRATSEVRLINKEYKKTFQKIPDAKGSPNEGEMVITMETIETIDTEVITRKSVDGVGSSDVFDERLHTLKNVNSSLNRMGVDTSTILEVERRLALAMAEGDDELAASLVDQMGDEMSRLAKAHDDQVDQEASDPPDLPRVPEDDPGARTRVTERLQKARERIAFVEGLGMDTLLLVEMEGRAEEALAQGKMELADDLVNQISTNIPRQAMDYLNQRINDANDLIKESREQGFEVDEQRMLLSKAMQAAAMGELETVMEVVDRVEIEVHTLRKRTTAKEAIDRGKRMGADVSDAEMRYAMGWKRQQEGEMEEALRYYSRAIDEAIKAGKDLAWKGEG